MSWTNVATSPELDVYRDEYGNLRLKSTLTGRFLPTTYQPAYGRAGYGETISIDVTTA